MALASTRQAGLALVAGVVLAMVGSLVFPGGPFVDSVDQTDFEAALVALGDSPRLGHLTSLMVIVGMLLHAYGLLGLLGLTRGQEGLRGPGLRFGILLSLFAWGIFTVAIGKRLMVIHLIQRSDLAETAEMQALFESAALTGHTEMAGLTVAFITMYPFASALVGLGLAPRFVGMDVFRASCYGLVVVGALGLLNLVYALFVPDTDLLSHLIINNLVLSFGSLCLLILGIGMYRGRSEFTPDDAR